MRLISRLLVIAVFLLVVGGAVFLATWDMPPPLATTEKVISKESFDR